MSELRKRASPAGPGTTARTLRFWRTYHGSRAVAAANHMQHSFNLPPARGAPLAPAGARRTCASWPPANLPPPPELPGKAIGSPPDPRQGRADAICCGGSDRTSQESTEALTSLFWKGGGFSEAEHLMPMGSMTVLFESPSQSNCESCCVKPSFLAARCCTKPKGSAQPPRRIPSHRGSTWDDVRVWCNQLDPHA